MHMLSIFSTMSHPQIIQGGMGVGVSNWTLANAVSRCGQLGVVSGTAIDAVLVRRLQLGDLGGHIRRAFDHFPFPEMARRIFDRYFIPGGKSSSQPFKGAPLHAYRNSRHLTELTVLANFAEVFLAKEGHDGPVGINFLEKIQTPTLSSLYGAMLAGVAFILMGAGIPRTIPGILDDLAQGNAVSMKLDVADSLPGEEFNITFDPRDFCGGTPQCSSVRSSSQSFPRLPWPCRLPKNRPAAVWMVLSSRVRLQEDITPLLVDRCN